MHRQPGYKCPNQLDSRRSGVLKESNSFYFTLPFIRRLRPLSERTEEILDDTFSNSINCSLVSRSGRCTMLPFSWQVKDEI